MYTWKRWTKTRGGKDERGSNPTEVNNRLFTGRTGRDFIFKEEGTNNAPPESNMDYLLARVQNVHIADEARNEAETLINDWLNDHIIKELTGEEEENENLPPSIAPQATPTVSAPSWYHDTDTFLQQYLTKQGCGSKPTDNENEIDVYSVDEATAVNSVLNHLMQKPLDNSKIAKDLDLKGKREKMKKAKDPVLTMEMRHKQVREARQRREEELKKRREVIKQKKESERMAEQVVKQEEKRKLQAAKIEEEAIQREMAKIRREMLEKKKREAKELAARLNVVNIHLPDAKEDMVEENKKEENHGHQQLAPSTNLNKNSRLEEIETRIRKMEEIRCRRILKQTFSSWFILVLKQQAALGKAKAMSDWNCLLRTWTAWRRYTLQQVVQRDTTQQQIYRQQLKVKETRVTKSRRVKILHKAFNAWKKFVKMEQYNKELLEQQEATKAKMKALLDNVAAKTKEQETVVVSLDDTENYCGSDISKTKVNPPQKLKTPNSGSRNTKKPNHKPIHAWQVNKNHVKNLTVDEIQSIGDAPSNHGNRKVKSSQPNNFTHRYKFQKQVINEQTNLINEQKQLIDQLTQQQRQVNVALERQVKERFENVENETKSSPSDQIRNTQSNRPPRSLVPVKRPKSVIAMEERAAERARRRQELEEKRKEEERAKVEHLKKEENERQLKEEEEKREKVQMLRELKKLKEQKEKEKQDWIIRMRELKRIAEDHYRRTLMKKLGINPWKKLMEIGKKKMEVAVYHHCCQATRVAFHIWKTNVKEKRTERENKADLLYNVLLKRKSLSSWRKYGERLVILEQKADIHYNNVVKVKYIRLWEQYVTDERLSLFTKEESAVTHDRLRLLRSAFKSLKHHRQLVKRDEQRRHRVADMRRKVAQLLPDFCPESSLTT
nr:coiled-coil domain-containing protein 191 isoform X1 [Ciona intestinalis]|eukprot:XP_026689584.1 coiled-coil domain-containing protein 191 isoform X1 [Ciona intestinalis]